MATTMTSTLLSEDALPSRTESFRRRGLIVGGAALGLGVLWGVISPSTFWPAYLAAYVYFLGLGVGSLALLMLHYLTGGNWGFLIRRPLEAATMTLPLMALLFLPLLLGMSTLYKWADPATVKASATLLHKARYLNVPFFLVRAAIYFGVWVGMAYWIRRGSMEQDAVEDPSPSERTQAIAAPGLVALFLTVTFASIDWMMSIEADWYSSIYGVMVFAGMALSALALTVLAASLLADVRPLSDLASAGRFNDLGNLMLAFTMLWAYMAFSQYLIIWSGNLAEEVPWYIRRSAGGWRLVCAALMLFHFFAPFFCLLVRDNKRSPARIGRIAAAILAMQLLNDVWLVIPAFPGAQWVKLLALVPAVLGVGGLWASVFTWQLTSRPLVPRHDPMLAEALSHHEHEGGP
jgi:hypothetical protein